MASNGPYYQPVQAHDQTPISDEMRLAQGILDYTAVAPQASMYPEPNVDYHHAQQLAPDQDTEDHAQLQGLVEAATSAAAQERNRQRALSQFAHSDQELATLLRDPPTPARPSKRKRSDSLSANHHLDPSSSSANPTSTTISASKRHRTTEDDAQHSPHLDARAAGVHSAAALFRPASDSSKKYTRPPMSKLFTSLELSPENFLYLQAAAKQYMLDTDYPDRQACVGNRGRGDNEMVKARMYQCVREFLETEGWGEKYFGQDADPPEQSDGSAQPQPRRYQWPRDRDRLIALCTPLLRRMVTNERQRQYAIETRKGGKPDNLSPAPANPTDASTPRQHHDPLNNPTHDDLQQSEHLDVRLNPSPGYQIYLLGRETGQLIHDRVSFALDHRLEWQWLAETLVRHWCEALDIAQHPPHLALTMLDRFTIKVLTSSGFTNVSCESEWQLAQQDVQQTVFLDAVTKVVVDCPLQA